jgi:PAS domain S-box-containing protein
MPIDGYTFAGKLRSDSTFVLWRAQAPDSERVLVQLPAATPIAEECRSRMAHEFGLRESLSPAWAVVPVRSLLDASCPALVFDDPGGDLLDQLAGQPLNPARFLSVSIAVADALAQAHDAGLIHKDIRPANVLLGTDGCARLTGFGLAARSNDDKDALAGSVTGSFAYMAPEQTGRLNRPVDARSDLYALGITLFELLTGTLPFTAADPMEWIHCHVTQRPPSPAERAPGIPPEIAAIVMRLLEKAPEDRFQSGKAVAEALRQCRDSTDDTTDAGGSRSRRPQPWLQFTRCGGALYGRDLERAALRDAFERVRRGGACEVVAVSGYSGVGKSSLVHQLRDALAPSSARFIAGKFDQYQRGIPYCTIAQAFAGLVRGALDGGEAARAQWERRIGEALGASATILCDVVPELAQLLGAGKAVPSLSPNDSKNRLHAAFGRFTALFASAQSPLVIFIDDLQWLDAGSLQLIEALVTDTTLRHVLVLVAYRDNDLPPDSALLRSLDAMRNHGTPVTHLPLGPLPLGDTNSLLADLLVLPVQRARELAEVVHEHTGGNPYFAAQFLSTLHDEGMLEFDTWRDQWTWDSDRVRGKAWSDNVVDLMGVKLRRLPAPTIALLKRLAALGGRASLTILALVHGQSERKVARLMDEPTAASLVARESDSFRFTHDRVQEAAYALISPTVKPSMHLTIARRMVSRLPPDEVQEHLFEIVGQFSHAIPLLRDDGERHLVRRLNLSAGRRAKSSAAWVTARSCLAQAVSLWGAVDGGAEQSDRFEAELALAECEFLVGDRLAAERMLTQLLSTASSVVDRVRLHRLQVSLYQLTGRFDDAERVAVEGLRLFGMEIPTAEDDVARQVHEQLTLAATHMRGRTIAELADAPPVIDPAVRNAIGLLTEAAGLAFITRSGRLPVLIVRALNVTLEHGNAPESCLAYGYYARLLVTRFDDIVSAFEFSQMSMELNQRLDDRSGRGRLLFSHGAFIHHWRRPISGVRQLLEDGYTACLDSGNFTYAGFIGTMLIWSAIEASAPLDAVTALVDRFSTFARQTHNAYLEQLYCLHGQFSACMKGLTVDPVSFSGGRVVEENSAAVLASANFRSGLAQYHVLKLMSAYVAGDFDAAQRSAAQAREVLVAIAPQPAEGMFTYFVALTAAAQLTHESRPLEAARLRADLDTGISRLKHWAEHCPENYGRRHSLLRAELARLEHREWEALSLYEESARLARDHGCLYDEGIANELAAAFFHQHGHEALSRQYMRNARDCYARWGAHGKVRSLDQRHPGLSVSVDVAAAVHVRAADIDLLTVAKAAQAVSGELGLERLIETLMRIVVQQACAERGILVLEQGQKYIAAQADAHGQQITVQLKPTTIAPGSLPLPALEHVLRTCETLVIGHASAVARMAASDHGATNETPASAICLPLVKQGKAVGVLYLENKFVPNVFTPTRVTVLELLAGQAAIALENARLYAELREHRDRLDAQVRDRTSDLKHTLQELQLVFDNAPLGITHTVHDRSSGTVHRANHAAEQMLRYGPGELVGLSTRQLSLNDQQHRRIGRICVDIISQGKVFRGDWPCLRKDGSEALLGLVGCALDRGDPAKGVVWLFDDITEKRRIREEVLELNANLQRKSETLQATLVEFEKTQIEAESARQEAVAANIAKSRFLAAASHDLRQPMHALDLYLGCADSADVPEHTRAVLGNARKCARTMGEMFGALLDISKLDSGVIHPQPRSFPICRILHEVALQFEPEAAAAGMSLRVAPSSLSVYSDPALVARILSNFVANGIRHARGSRMLLGCRRRGASACLAVYDQGPGIPLEKQQAVFDEFVQLDNPERDRSKGLGLGLAIVSRLAKLLGAPTVLVSRPGRGAMFGVDLPLAASAKEVPDLSRTRPLELGQDLTGAVVVVIDDEATILDAASMLLKKWGCTVVVAASGKEAYQHIVEDLQIPDVVICDYRLRGDENGIGVVKMLSHALGVNLPALLITGDTAPERIREIDASQFAVLHKPVEPSLLRKTLVQLLRQGEVH